MKPIANAQVHSTNTNYRHDIETGDHTLRPVNTMPTYRVASPKSRVARRAAHE